MQMAHFLFTLRALVVISYFALTIFFYIRAPSPSRLFNSNFPVTRADSGHRSVGVFGDAMVAMLGTTEEPFTIFVPSQAAFQNVSSMFREEQAQDLTDANSAAYAVMSHLLSFSAVPKSILSKHVPFDKEVVFEAMSGFLISMTRVHGKGLLVNNMTCSETDLRRGRLVLHVVNGVVMDSEFAQSMVQDALSQADEEDVKPDWEEEEEQQIKIDSIV